MSCARKAQATFANMLSTLDQLAGMTLEVGLAEDVLAASLTEDLS